MRITLRYSQIEQALASLAHIAPSKRKAFGARLKHLRTLGFPDGVNTGRGQMAHYSYLMYMQMVIALELMQAGVSPIRVVKIVNGNWSNLKPSIFYALKDDRSFSKEEKQDHDFAWLIHPESLRDLAEENEEQYSYYESIDIVPIAKISEVLDKPKTSPLVGEDWRVLLLRARQISLAALWYIVHQNPEINRNDIYADISDELADDAEKLKEALEWSEREGPGRTARNMKIKNDSNP